MMKKLTINILFYSVLVSTTVLPCMADVLFNYNVNDNSELKKQAKELFNQRDQKSKLEEAIKTMEQITANESDYEISALLSRAYYFLAEYADQKDAKLEIYMKGLKAGEMAMNTIESFTKAMNETKKEEEAIKVLTLENMDALYWSAANIARWAKFAPFTKKVSSKSRVRALWDRVFELNPAYFNGGAFRFFGGYYALVPSITGDQDPVKSKEMFDKSLQAAPQYLETKVLYAEAYCTHAKIQDKELFKKLLNEVMEANIDAYPDLIPENKIAKEKAKKLLAAEKELFE